MLPSPSVVAYRVGMYRLSGTAMGNMHSQAESSPFKETSLAISQPIIILQPRERLKCTGAFNPTAATLSWQASLHSPSLKPRCTDMVDPLQPARISTDHSKIIRLPCTSHVGYPFNKQVN